MFTNYAYRLLFISALFFAGITSSYAGENLKNAWLNFNENKYSVAADYCDKAINESGEDVSEALILKVIIADIYDDDKTAVASMDKFIRTSKNINPYVFSMWMTRAFAASTNYKNDRHVEFLEELLENHELNGTVKAWIYEMLAGKYKNQYDYSEAKKIAAKLGGIADWQVTGTFENISASGFDNDYGPLTHPEPSAKFINKNGAEITWFDKIKPFEGNWLDLMDNFVVSSSIVFAQTFFESESAAECQLRIGTSGSLKVWVNDKLVISVSEERNNGLDTYIAKIKINKGNNRLLMQIGTSEIQRSNYFARITDSDGEPVKGLQFSTKYKPYSKETSFNSEVLPNFAEEYFNGQIKKDSTDLLNYFLLSKCYEMNEKLPEARNVMLQARKIAPNSSYILNELSNIYYRLNDRTNHSLIIETLRAADKNYPVTILWDFEEALQNEKYEDALKCLQKLDQLSQNKPHLFSLRAKLYANEKKVEDFVTLVENGYSQFPDSYDMVSLKYVIEKNLKNDVASAMEILKKYIAKNNNLNAISDLAEDYKSLGNNTEYFSILDELINVNPNGIGFYYQKGTLLFDMREYKKAAELFQKCIEIAPYQYGYYHELGNAYKEMGNTEMALKQYAECIKYNPYQYAVREKIRILNNKKSLFEYLPEPDVYKIFKDTQAREFDKSDNAVVLLNQTNKVVYSGSASEERTYLLVKVLSPKGIDNYKEYSIFTYPNQDYIIEKAEVLKKSGEKLKGVVENNDIVFSNLGEGDAVLIIYKTQNYQFGALSKHFWAKKVFDSYYPCLKNKYTMLVSPDVKFDYKMSNSDFKPEITKEDEFTIYNWERSDKKMINSEMYMPYIVDFAELLDISTVKDWDFISKWYFDIVNNKANSSFETKEVIKEIFPNGDPKDKLAAVKTIYEYVTRHIRYSHVPFLQSGIIPQKASDVINTKLGDCKDVSTLFVALCREIKIDAYWMLVCTRDYGRNYLKLPSIDFNHCIATVELDGKKYYVELTSDKLPFGTIYGDLLGAMVLEINNKKENNLFYLNPKDRFQNAVHRSIDVKFEEDKMLVNVNTVKIGGPASYQRASYRDLSPDEQKKSMSKAIGSDYPQISLLNLEFDHSLHTTSDSCTYIYGFKVENVFTSFAGMSAFKVPFVDNLEPNQVFSVDERKYPFDFYEFMAVDDVDDEVVIAIPQGMTLIEKPESVNLVSDFGTYTLNYVTDKDKIKIHRKLFTKKDFVPPQDFAKVKDFFNKVYKNDSKQLAFKKM